MGAGYSGLRQIATLRPTYLKLDRSLIAGIDTDTERGALVAAMLGYARQTGGHLVAEGVETEAELETLLALGVELVQGYYLARPGWPWPEVRQLGPGCRTARARPTRSAAGPAASGRSLPRVVPRRSPERGMEMRQVSPFGLLRGAAAAAWLAIVLACAAAAPAVRGDARRRLPAVRVATVPAALSRQPADQARRGQRHRPARQPARCGDAGQHQGRPGRHRGL